MSMYCPYCFELAEGNNTCPSCGSFILEDELLTQEQRDTELEDIEDEEDEDEDDE